MTKQAQAAAPAKPTIKPTITLSRRIWFSAGLHLNSPLWDAIRNREVYGRDVLPHGHEYALEVAWRGPVSPQDGMIINLIEIKPILATAVSYLENRHLNREVPAFQSQVPTVENVARFLWEALAPNVSSATLTRLKLEQSRRTRVEIKAGSTPVGSTPVFTMKVARSYEFAAAHRLHLPSLSEAANWERFDKCSNPAGHGHNFQLEVWVEGTPDPDSGYIINPTHLDSIVNDEVYARFDHKHLNEDCPEFSDLVPTSENLARVIFDLLTLRLQSEGYQLARVGLRETQKNYFEVEA